MAQKTLLLYKGAFRAVSFREFTTVILCQSPSPFCRETFSRVDAVIRKGYAAEKNRAETDGSHAPKAPHVRRAHWHNYWTGARESAERCLVLKWIPPVFVGGASADIATIHPVKGGQP